MRCPIFGGATGRFWYLGAMLFELPDPDHLYEALLARDERYEGQAYVCVSSTGIFCRLSCPARKPRRDNCTFHASVAECLGAGYRPCKRCHPMGTAAEADDDVQRLLAALEAEPQRRWAESDLSRMGLDLSTVRRRFKRQFGMTFLEMARQRRLRAGFEELAQGAPVIEAQQQAAFESPSAFRRAFAGLLGMAPGALREGGQLVADWIATPLGDMLAVCSANQLHLLEFMDRRALPRELAALVKAVKGDLGLGRTPVTEQAERELDAYFTGGRDRFETPLAFHGSAFSRQVWTALCEIPAGETRSYADLAAAIGRPTAVRAVARANGANQISLMIPCHRVIGADGSLTGYGGGLWRKQRLIDIERQYRRPQ